MRTEAQRQQQADANNERVEQAAAAAVYLLMRRRDAVVADGLRRGLAVVAIAALLETQLQEALAQARAMGRSAAEARTRAELESLGVVLVVAVSLPRLMRDTMTARRFAQRYTQAWLAAAQATSATEASRLTAARLETTGITEAASVFNERRLELARSFPGLMRRWDATNDIRTCPTCFGAHGTVVGVHQPFPLGEPGKVHPRCRCTWQLLAADEI